jgi:hypothetical protein
MRSLAVGRYRFLTTNRAAVWVLGMSIGAALFGAFAVIASASAMYSMDFISVFDTELRRGDPALIISLGGRMLELCYAFHILILAAACHAFGSRDRRSDASGEGDLMDTAPITPAARFWGDAMGVFASTMAVHFATLPLLAFVFALSPFPAMWMLWVELAIVAIVALDSAGASWKLHTSRNRSATARTAASAATLIITIIATVWALTSWGPFKDALAVFIVWPSPRAWSAIVATILSPMLLAFALLMIFAGFTLFYYFRAVRAVEQG